MSTASVYGAASDGNPTVRDWCPVCCTLIEGTHRCPGPLLATGHERHGFRVHVETPYGLLAFGVLVAPSHDLWRARILTYPNMLWTVPGGGASLKFSGATPQEAERKAIAFIDRHCEDKGYRRRDQVEPVEVRSFSAEADHGAPRSRTPQASPRKPCSLPVRFGGVRASRSGATVNVSREGMFIGTPTPLAPGESVRIHMDVEGYTLPLRGVVMWNRRKQERGRPLGMGIRLIDPVPGYPRFVDTLP